MKKIITVTMACLIILSTFALYTPHALGEKENISATVDIAQDCINLNTTGKWINAYIELPAEFNVNNIQVSTIMLNDTIPAELQPTSIGDYDEDTIPDLMVTFNRTKIAEWLSSIITTYGNATLNLTGQAKTAFFAGTDTIAISNLAGDVDCDGKVGLYDATAMLVSYRSREDEPKWNPNADLAPPYGIINIFDFVTFLSHYGEKY